VTKLNNWEGMIALQWGCMHKIC